MRERLVSSFEFQVSALIRTGARLQACRNVLVCCCGFSRWMIARAAAEAGFFLTPFGMAEAMP
jgi:hypothetical protein